MDVDARIEGLEAENERLRDRIDALEAAMGMNFLTPIEWGLTGHEMRVFGVLMARELATKAACMAALYRDRGDDEPQIKIVDVFVCKMRKKLERFALPVETRWGQGYFLTPETKTRVRSAMALDRVAA